MAEDFLRLTPGDRADALEKAAYESGRPADLLEKDVWLVRTLDALFTAPFAPELSFKGGSSLSKAYRAIARFSEDVDVTYDIRALLPDLMEGAPDPLPATRSEERKWTRSARQALEERVRDVILPALRERLDASGDPAELRGEKDRILVRYRPVTEAATDYVAPEVVLEFGARSTGEPAQEIPVTCDAAEHLPMVAFPTATPRVMAAARTFWEKATAMHVYCCQHRLRGERYARHWYDLVQLDRCGIAEEALARQDIARSVALHKHWFFREKDSRGLLISYQKAVTGRLRLVPEGAAHEVLGDDYARMLSAGLIPGDTPSFEDLIEGCRQIERRANTYGDARSASLHSPVPGAERSYPAPGDRGKSRGGKS